MKKFAMSTTVLASLTMMVSVASATPTVQSGSTWTAHTTYHIKTMATSAYQSGMTPAQMRHAYGLDQLSNDGSGQTVAIVDAYGSPTISQDLNTFDAQFGLPAASLTIAQPGGTPATDGGWALETSLDVEWVHAMAPAAQILLVEAPSASTSDLLNAISYATSHGAQVVSNSWGGSEFSSESSYDSYFNHSGVVTVASSGDNGAGSSWPAVSPYVVGVGGTTLNVDSSGNWLSESGWSGSGGDTSWYYGEPSYQASVDSVVQGWRGMPDVAMDADPNTGAAVYDSTPDNGSSGWWVIGGTSLAAPMFGALISLADQSRSTKLDSWGTLTDLYNYYSNGSYSTDFHDITSGNNGYYSCTSGYDLVTGIGSPNNNLVNDLISAP